MDNSRLTFLTTASCNGGCKHCSVTPWMQAHDKYQMPLTDIASFIFCSKISGYHFDQINLAGGEPLLWEWIIQGASLLKSSGIVDVVCVITNGLLISKGHHDFIKRLSDIAVIKISEYIGNDDNIKYAQDHFPGIQVSPQILRPVTPDRIIEGTLPADCVCRGRGFFNGMVTVCSPYKTLGVRVPSLETPLKEGFLSHFDKIKRMNQPYCQVCVANKNIYPHIKWYKNEVQQCHA